MGPFVHWLVCIGFVLALLDWLTMVPFIPRANLHLCAFPFCWHFSRRDHWGSRFHRTSLTFPPHTLRSQERVCAAGADTRGVAEVPDTAGHEHHAGVGHAGLQHIQGFAGE